MMGLHIRVLTLELVDTTPQQFMEVPHLMPLSDLTVDAGFAYNVPFAHKVG